MELPRTLCGDIVCALVSKSAKFNKRLCDLNRKFLAIETESGGLFPGAGSKGSPVIVIRGISDYADDNKTALELSTAGSVRRLAAGNAASFFKLQIHNRYVKDFIEKRRGEAAGHEPKDNQLEISGEPLNFEELVSQIDANLRQLSPALKYLSPSHYIPTPRIIRSEPIIEPRSVEKRDIPIDVRDALKTKRRLYINVPPTFPDNSVPWVIARGLVDVRARRKAVVPIVVHGNVVGPPKRTIELSVQHQFFEFNRDNYHMSL